MQLDWAQIVTQALGFLLALLILKRYAWGPILGLIEQRQEKIKSDFSAAEGVRREAEAFKRELEAKLRESDAQGRARIVEAVNEGQRVAAEMREKARADSQALLDKAREEMARDRDKAREVLREEMVDISLAAAAKLVEKKLDTERDREIAREFVADLERIR